MATNKSSHVESYLAHANVMANAEPAALHQPTKYSF